MKKKSFLALLLAAALLLSGCALVSTDEKADNAQVIVDVGGQTVDKATIKAAVQYEIENNQQLNSYYAMFGMDSERPTDEASIIPVVIDGYVQNLVAAQKAKEWGCDQLTDEETAEAQASAQEQYDALLDQVVAYYYDDEELTDEEAREKAAAFAVENGATLESYVESAVQQKSLEKLQREAVKDVALTEEDLQAAYETATADAKAEYEEKLTAFGTAYNNGETVYYTPAGYRLVKQILVKFTEEDSTALNDANLALNAANNALTLANRALSGAAADDDQDALQADVTNAELKVAAAQADYDAVYAAAQENIQEKLQEVYAAATAEGADFDALIAQYNEDPGMPADGYALCEGFTDFVASFTAAGMGLENIGDVSEPAASTYGYHILQYSKDLEEGPAALEDVREPLSEQALASKQAEAFNSLLQTWVNEADVKTYPEKMN